MHLARLRVEHWRCHGELELADMPPGAVLIAGPNESGKSSLVEALHYALFEQISGKGLVRSALVPAGTREAPRVEADLVVGDATWTVSKRFVHRPACTLAGSGEHLEGDAAEARLQELLGVRVARRGRITGEVDPDLLRFWPALWLRQERHGDLEVLLTEGVRSSLGEAIAVEVGDLTIGERVQGLRARAAEEAARYWTPTGKPTAELREARAAATAAAEELEAARAAHARAAGVFDQLRACEARRAELAGRLREARARRADLEARGRDVAELRAELAAGGRREAELATALAEAERRRAGREALVRRLAELEPRRSTVVDEEGVAAAALRRAERVAADARAARDAAEAAHDRARSAQRRVEARREAAALRAEDARLADLLARVEGLRERRRACAAELGGLPGVDEAALKEIEEGERTLADARLLRDAAAVRVAVRAEAETRLAWDDEEPAALGPGDTAERSVTSGAVLRLPGVAEIRLDPGSGELRDRREAVDDAQRALARALEARGVTEPDAARRAHRRRAELHTELERLDERLADDAPDGVEAIRTRREEIAGRLEARPEHGDPGHEPPSDHPHAASPDDPAAAEAAARAVGESEADRAAARAVLEGAEADLTAARESLATARQRRHELDREVAVLEARLDEFPPAGELAAALEARTGELTAARESLGALNARLAGLGADEVEELLEQVGGQLASFEAELAELDKRRHGLDGELRSHLSADPHARLQDAEAEAARADASCGDVEARAAATRSLVATLDAVIQETRTELSRPVLARIEPYLARVFPERGIDLDVETWSVAGLVGEPLDRLSVGAREQFALLVRLGLAEVFAAGERLPLVLDDPLVNADPERSRALLGALRKASRHLQILLFTCHEADHDELYADARFVLPDRHPAGRAPA